MRFEALRRTSPQHPPNSLALRGGLARTFGGLAPFLVLTFLCSGIYILEEAFAKPLAAQAATLIFGTLIIALATILLYYLGKPGKEPRRMRQDRPHPGAGSSKQEIFEEVSRPQRQGEGRKELVYQRI